MSSSGKKDKKVVNRCELLKIEKEIDVVVELVDDDLFSTIRKEKMIILEVQKAKILKQDEESCRLKSWATWLSQGDNNTK